VALHLDELNDAQKDAVTFGKGPLLIIAGAGTGKTKVITHRIAYLITKKLALPEEILAVTFTEKAANEMEERVDQLIPYSYSFVEISTFNSFGEKVLRDYGIELGFGSDFKLLDEVEQAIFFREHLFKMPLHHFRPLSTPTKYIQELLVAIKRLKQEDVEPEKYLIFAEEQEKKAEDPSEKENAQKHLEIAKIYKTYQDIMHKEGKIDFEDQVTMVVNLFRARPSVLSLFQEKYKYILVDEFQDTNYIQFELLKLMAETNKNLTVVGDDDQSIFRFRGASLRNIMDFRTVYPGAKEVVLKTNYRSTQDILDSAYQLIQHNNPYRLEVQEKIEKSLKAARESVEKSLHMLQFDTLSHETDKVAEIIVGKVEKGYRYSDMAILVRRNADADPFLRALNMREIPYRFSGSRGLYSQAEVKILIAFIKSLTDFEDSHSLFHLALSDVYGLDPYDLTKVTNFSRNKNQSLHNVFRSVAQNKDSFDIALDSRKIIKRIFQDLMDFIALAGKRNAGEVLFSFLERSGFLKSLVSVSSLENEIKIKNIRLFFNKVKGFSELTDDDSIHTFSGHLDLLQQVGDNPASAEAELDVDAVQVLTVHKAKGLEFSVVFLVNLIMDRFPGRSRVEKITIPNEILKEELPQKENIVQEERRLFYVGMTRAEKALYLTWSQDHGLKRPKKVSPFVLEALDLPAIPQEVLKSSPIEELRRFSPQNKQKPPVKKNAVSGPIHLSFFQVDSYLTCPFKYKIKHVFRLAGPPHHNLVFGRVLHSSIYHYLKKKMTGGKTSERGLIAEFKKSWVNEGFLSREHEEMRKKAGEKALKLFYRREESSSQLPLDLEKEFRWQEKDMRFVGRWDRIDHSDDGAVIIDFKSTEIKDQKTADKRTRDSLQMDIYALSFLKMEKTPLLETQMHFLLSDVVGHAQKTEKELHRAENKIAEAEDGIRRQDFHPKPDWHNCSHCEFKTFCPHSYAY